ncbi:MAG: glycine cleavage system protein T, partial [Actinomycetota bacterium]|nr:glycine cleavage system protein T [Actinomycetota bacterium]
EDGFEIYAPIEEGGRVWDALLVAGRDHGLVPVGLGARDTLRLEAGFPLHGHELGPGITPLQAGLAWAVGWDKPSFSGREPLLGERAAGPRRRLRGVTVEGRRPPRAGRDVRHQGAVVGRVTSGNFSPSLGRGIALAFVPPELAVGERVEVVQASGPVPATLVGLPFVARPS